MVIYLVVVVSLLAWWSFSHLIVEYDKEFTIRKWLRIKFGNAPVIKEVPKEKKLDVAIFRAAADLSGIVLSCALIFMVFNIWLQLTISKVPEMVIARVEWTAHFIREKINIFKVNPWIDGILIYILLSLPVVLSFTKYLGLSDKYSAWNKWIGKSAQVLAIFTTFTFFGVVTKDHVQAKADELEIHSLQLIENNKLVHSQIYKALEDDIADAFLQLPEIEQSLNKAEVSFLIQRIDVDPDLAEYAQYHNVDIYSDLESVLKNYFKEFDWKSGIGDLDQKIGEEYSNLKTSSGFESFSEIIQNQESKAFIAENKEWIRTNVSENSTEQLTELLKREKNKIRSPFFEKYSPVLKKFFKAGYKKTIKEGFNHFARATMESYPFLAALVDIFVHDPIQETLWQKAESYFKNMHLAKQASDAGSIAKVAEPFVSEILARNANYADEFERFAKVSETIKSKAEIAIQNYINEKRVLNRKVKEHFAFLMDLTPYTYLASRHSSNPADDFNWRYNRELDVPSEEEWRQSLWENRYHLYNDNVRDASPLFSKMVSEFRGEKVAKEFNKRMGEAAARQAARKQSFWKIARKVLRRGR